MLGNQRNRNNESLKRVEEKEIKITVKSNEIDNRKIIEKISKKLYI